MMIDLSPMHHRDRILSRQPPLEHLVCGTAYYCAPEAVVVETLSSSKQVWFHDYSPSVDVWAAGVRRPNCGC